MAVKRESKSKKFTFKMKKKLLVIYLLTGLFLIFLSISLIKINLKKGKEYSKAVYDNFTYDSRIIYARRGDITDRNGTILAYSTKVYTMIIDAKVILSDEKFREPTVEALRECFPSLDIAELNAHLDENKDKEAKSSYKRFMQELTEEEVNAFNEKMEKDKKVKGVWFESKYKRVYPHNSLAADMIGFSSDANGGEIGVELYYDKYLAGTDGRTYGYIDNSSYKSQVIPAINGNTLVTTIDYGVQNIIENKVKDWNDEFGSLSTTVVVMNPNNGEILGMADYPTFDLNNPRDVSSIYTQEELDEMDEEEKVEAYYKLWSNNSISKIYEPGSVFKTFTIASVVEENLCDFKKTFYCDGYAVYDHTKIKCNHVEGHGDMTIARSLQLSCNDALMQMGELLGKTTFSKYLNIFKFGIKTDIDLPSEEAGLVISEERMMDVDLATNSFGQNISVNMLQMMSGFASIINGGKYYRPHVVKQILDSSGELVKENKKELVAQTVSEETTEVMRAMLRSVVDYGTAGYLYMEGYSIGGKTGAAEKIPRDKKSYVVSFLGFAPCENPEVLVYVVIDSPKVEDYSSSYAAQMLSSEIYKELLPYLGITPDDPEYKRDLYLNGTDEEPIRKRPISFDPNVEPEDGDVLPQEDETLSDEEIQEEQNKESQSQTEQSQEDANNEQEIQQNPEETDAQTG